MATLPQALAIVLPRALNLATERKRVIVPVAGGACDDDTDEHQDRHFQATVLA
jgi:hypothetical protein